VKIGDSVEKGQIIGKEGNRGYVFAGGVEIMPAMQKAVDKRRFAPSCPEAPCASRKKRQEPPPQLRKRLQPAKYLIYKDFNQHTLA
jgi:murein DD-endopeptidase MepM/ murein hydrolase activator NlpD